MQTKPQKQTLEYYTTHGIMTDPGKHINLYKNLPSEVADICKVTQGLMIHMFHTKRYGIKLPKERGKEVNLRKTEDILAKIIELDDRPITIKREPDKRVVGICRDFSVLTVSLLRHKGIPARSRAGFAGYFIQGLFEDHWICEYWDKTRNKWIKIDSQLDSLLLNDLKIKADPLNLSDNDFMPAGRIWKLCKSGQIDPDKCGLSINPNLKGYWFIKENVFRDFMSLNKFEVLPWDGTEFMRKEMDENELEIFNEIVELTAAKDLNLTRIRALYDENPGFRMPDDWKP